MNERIKQLRTSLNLNQEAFGARLGVQKSQISRMESGTNNITESMQILICREFNVNYLWLTTGEGDMFIDLPDTILDELALQYGLTDEEKELTKEFLSLPKEERSVIMKFFRPNR